VKSLPNDFLYKIQLLIFEKKPSMKPQLLIAFFAFLSTQCWSFNVTFRLDFSDVNISGTPEVNGTFNNWCGSCAPMSDEDGDGIWERTIDLAAGNYEYKFSYSNWSGQEYLSPGTTCTVTVGEFTNRTLTVNNTTILPVVCWGFCGSCIEPDPINWELFWSDEFDGDALDTEIWTTEFGASGWGNNEWQYYTANESNVDVVNGKLIINAREESYLGADYTSSRIITNNKFEFMYGRVEARIKLPMGQGIWPAFWMLGANFEDVGWPHCGEIDIMEHINNEMMTHGTVHWFNNSHTYTGLPTPLDPTQFHNYGIYWDEDKIQFYVNDFIYNQFNITTSNNSDPIFNRPFFFILNIAVGGNWPGYPNNNTPFPATMEVDYVRVYKPQVSNTPEVAETSIQVYPNPAVDVLQVTTNESQLGQPYRVISQDGKTVLSGMLNASVNQIQVDQLSAGVYFVNVGKEQIRFVKK